MDKKKIIILAVVIVILLIIIIKVTGNKKNETTNETAQNTIQISESENEVYTIITKDNMVITTSDRSLVDTYKNDPDYDPGVFRDETAELMNMVLEEE